LRGTENSYVTKINYDREGNPIKEVLQTKVFHANDKGQKIMEKEKRYINDQLGEEKISKEKILGDKAIKVVTKKSKNRPEEVKTYLKGGLREDQLDDFNREYERVKHEIKQQQLSQQQQYRQLGQQQDQQYRQLDNRQQQDQQYRQLDQNRQQQDQQYRQVDQSRQQQDQQIKQDKNKNVQQQDKNKVLDQKDQKEQKDQKDQKDQKKSTLHDDFESHHEEGYQLAQNKDQNIDKNLNQQQQKKNL